jgi:TolA-binding protein
MKSSFWFSALMAALTICPAHFVFAGDEMVQLHSQVSGLAEQVSRLERAIDENVGVMTDLVNRNTQTTVNMERDAEQLKNHLEQQNKVAGTQLNKVSEEIGAWQTELSKFRTRLEAATSSPLPPRSPQVLPTAPSPALSTQAASANPPATQAHPPSTPPAETPQPEPASGAELYRSAMDHYASKDFEIAATEFAKYLKIDHQSENATNARYLLADIEYEEKDFEGALDDYTAVGPRLSDPAKAARAQYRKALCLIEVDRADEAILELQDLRTRYPHSAEATQAAKKLRALHAQPHP